MFKGLIDYQGGKIPFVINNYQMDLFAEEELIPQFAKEYNFKTNYILSGQCYVLDNTPRDITLLVERSMGYTCYLTCFTVNSAGLNKETDAICFEASVLDSIFRCKYNYLDLSRDGINLAAEQREIYSIPFNIDDRTYKLNYLIGQDNRLGLLENFEMRGKAIVCLQTVQIEECYKITLLMHRFAKFITSYSDISFERITLPSHGLGVTQFYCKGITNDAFSDMDFLFFKFPVMKYTSRILDNLAYDLDNKVTRSIPLGHLTNHAVPYTPHRFLEQITAFEYLFEKLEPKKADCKKFPLKAELKLMFDLFPEVLNDAHMNSDEVADYIKEVRRHIIHGYTYYYNFGNDSKIQFCIMKTADLLRRMSLRHIGFDDSEIDEFSRILTAF
jgi:hypothetical protein